MKHCAVAASGSSLSAPRQIIYDRARSGSKEGGVGVILPRTSSQGLPAGACSRKAQSSWRDCGDSSSGGAVSVHISCSVRSSAPHIGFQRRVAVIKIAVFSELSGGIPQRCSQESGAERELDHVGHKNRQS